jgi:hypothetical protein
VCQDTNEFKKGYQPRTNLVKDENGDLLADSHNILNRWKNYYSKIPEEKWGYNETVHQLFVDFKKAYDSIRREVLYNILTEFGVPLKPGRLIK